MSTQMYRLVEGDGMSGIDVRPEALEHQAEGFKDNGFLGVAKVLRAAAARIRELESGETRVSPGSAGALGGRISLVLSPRGELGEMTVAQALEAIAQKAGVINLWRLTLAEFASQVKGVR